MGYETMAKQNAFPIVFEPTAILWYSFSFVHVEQLSASGSLCKDFKKENQKYFIVHAHDIKGYNENVDINIKLSPIFFEKTAHVNMNKV